MTYATLKPANAIVMIKFSERNATSVSLIFGDFRRVNNVTAMDSLIVVIKLLVFAITVGTTHMA